MAIRTIVISGFLLALSSIASAASGTPEEQAACRPDVRRFCHMLKSNAGDDAFLQCLQAHRTRLTKACLKVLESHGQ